ncbi:hypothetical protein ABE485_07510 [Achromobacter spanius]|uniref:hypothetical protein n=1 Tax=Achromobacter spanius TaxID=217203 RepID=UPI003208F35C
MRDTILELVDMIAPKIESSILPIKLLKDGVPAEIIGTGFLAVFEDAPCLVTAAHVISEYGQANLCLVLNDIVHGLSSWTFASSREDDLCVAGLSPEFSELVRGNYKIPIVRNLGPLRNSCMGVVVLGFPQHFIVDGTQWALPISTHLEHRDISTSTKIHSPIIYYLNDEELANRIGTLTIPSPDMPGMSGSPAMAWTYIFSGPEEGNLSVALQSVLVQWHSGDGYLVGSATGRLVDLLDTAR